MMWYAIVVKTKHERYFTAYLRGAVGVALHLLTWLTHELSDQSRRRLHVVFNDE